MNRRHILELAAASTALTGLGLTGARAQDTGTIRIAVERLCTLAPS